MPQSPTRIFLTVLALCATSAASAQNTKSSPIPSRVQEIISSRCALCHGAEGESASAVFPRLAAQHPEYLQKQLKDFRDGRRKSDTMVDMSKDLTDDDVVILSKHFSSKKAGSRQPGDVDLAAVGRYIYMKGNKYSGVPSCASCHGSNGYGTAQLPRLAGQHPNYLELQLKEFNKRERTNDNSIMHSVASKLSELETYAVSVYLGTLQ